MSPRRRYESVVDDPRTLSCLVAEGLTTSEIAKKLDRAVRSVRIAMRRHGLDNRNDPRHPRFDAMLNDAEYLRDAHYVRGLTVVEIAREVHRHPAIVMARFRAAGIHTRQPCIYPALQDAAWLQSEFDRGGTLRSIAGKVGCSPSAVRAAADRAGTHRRRSPRAGGSSTTSRDS